MVTSTHLNEVENTKKQFLRIITGEYLITGVFWVFITLGSLLILGPRIDEAETFFFSLLILMFFNGIWEILTGWYADKFKRQFSMSAGFGACFVGFCLMGIAPFFDAEGTADSIFTIKLLVWNAGISIWSLGPALLSGSKEAWLVDRCNFFSQTPPEDVDDVFKKAAAYGIIAKSIGALICFLIFLSQSDLSNRNPGAALTPADTRSFVLSAIVAAVLSAVLLILSLRLREEYWSHPKYQTNESLLSFLRKGLQDLWKTPYRWFTLSYVGAMSLNYVLSPTIWPYMAVKAEKSPLLWVADEQNLLHWAGILIFAELIGSFLSRPLSKWIDQIKQHRLRMPVASLMYFVPILFLWILGPSLFLYILIAAAFLFRTVNASVFGSLNTIGQLAIKSDERRASLISMSSAISSFFMAGVFFVFFCISYYPTQKEAFTHIIENFWYYVPLPCILFLVSGGYLMARPHPRAR